MSSYTNVRKVIMNGIQTIRFGNAQPQTKSAAPATPPAPVTPKPPVPGAIPRYSEDGKIRAWILPDDKNRALMGR
jgi:hypothetical protein